MKKFLQTRIWWIVGLVGLYLAVSGASFWGWKYLLAAPGMGGVVPAADVEKARSKIDLSAPKTETCPLNGAKYTRAEREIWEGRRPMVMMVENHADSRPPSGLSRADIVYEAVAEGGITRFMAVFLCGGAAADVEVAPVRSSRIYFINFAAEYGNKPLYVHVGGANDFGGTGETDRRARALEELATLGWRVPRGNDIDPTYDAGFPEMWRDYERLEHPVATEHTYVASTDKVWAKAAARNLGAKDGTGVAWNKDFVEWRFDEKGAEGKTAEKISFYFWKGQFQADYAVEWDYDATSGKYLRKNGGTEHKDLGAGEQLSAFTVVVMWVREIGPVDVNKHLLYENVGKGEAVVFRNGKAVEATWEKPSQKARTKFYLKKGGAEVGLSPGTIWVEMLPAGNRVEY